MLSWPLITQICVLSLVAGFAGGFLGRVSASSQLRKQIREAEVAITDWCSLFERQQVSINSMQKREAVRQHRAKLTDGQDSGSAPPPGTSKAELRKFYGIPAGPIAARARAAGPTAAD